MSPPNDFDRAKRAAEKYRIGLAGEFLVAGELLRRGARAFITYGNAKKADVVIVRDNIATTIEVKTTRAARWVLGNQLPENDDSLWVLVHLPPDESPPCYFILSGRDLHGMLAPRDRDYRARFRERKQREFEGKGVVSVSRHDIADFKDRWDRITNNDAPGR